MRKLLSAGFHRLWKSRIFWIMLAVCAIIPLLICYDNFLIVQKTSEYSVALEDVCVSFLPGMGFVCAALISLLLSEEYSDGMLRSKLTVGHRRLHIYLANLIVCTIGSFLTLTALFLAGVMLGSMLFGGFQIDSGAILQLALSCFLLVAALSAIDVMIVMSCQNKAAAAVLSFLLVLVLLFAGSYLDSTLNEPEIQYGCMVMHENGTVTFEDPSPNPKYISGSLRTVLSLAEDIDPMGQAVQINNLQLERCARWPFLSLAVYLAVSAVGFVIFKKKDIK